MSSYKQQRASDRMRVEREDRSRLIDKVAQDIRAGENLEVYLTVLLALVLLFLDVFGIVSFEIIAAGILTTLALLAYSVLGSREQIENLMEVSNETKAIIDEKVTAPPSAEGFFWKEARLLEQEVAQAQSVTIIGITLSRTVGNYLNVLEKRLASGAHVRFLIIDPATSAPHQAIRRSSGMIGDSFYIDLVRPTIDLICSLAESTASAGTVELGLLPYVPSFGMLLIDPDEAHGRIVVEIYQHRSSALHPTFELEPQRDDHWYRFFRKQAELLWQSCGQRQAAGTEIRQFRRELQAHLSSSGDEGNRRS